VNDAPDSNGIRARLAVIERRLNDHEREISLHRDRIHEARNVAAKVDLAIATLERLREEMPVTAESAAERAIREAFQKHQESLQSREDRRWSKREKALGLLIGAWVSIVPTVNLIANFGTP
jgi:predicted ribosome quality control (RQC) complex YloA/Tae2 family protein